MNKKGKLKKDRVFVICILLIVIVGSIFLINYSKKNIASKPFIVLNENAGEVFIESEIVVTYTIRNTNPNIMITWSSSDPKIAEVDGSGKVTGLSFGDVVITATLNNGSSASTKISVKSYPVSLSVNTNIKASNNWYNKNLELTITKENIKTSKYCVTKEDPCTPDHELVDKITLKDGIWNLYISGIDRNNKEIEYHDTYKIDTTAPKCQISRIGKLTDTNTTINVTCDNDLSGISKYVWYCDEKEILTTDSGEIKMSQIMGDNSSKYVVKVSDNASNETTLKIN